MRFDIYKNMKLKGRPVIYETDTQNVYDKDGNFLCFGMLDDGKLKETTRKDKGVGGVKIVMPKK